jgi:Trk K+ transport system NAD-binding subunit
MKCLLAITNNPNRKSDRYHLVAEIRDPKNSEVAELIGKDELELVLVGDLVARIMAQTCRQSGLSVVYNELLDFGGAEIYFKEESSLVGKTFRDTLLAYEDSAVIGIRPANGAPTLNPSMETSINPGDRLVVIAENADDIKLSDAVAAPQADSISLAEPPTPQAESLLVLGWNWRGALIINELDSYVSKGSRVHVVANTDDAEAEIAEHCAALTNQQLTFQRGDTTNRSLLNKLDVSSFDHVIVLCYSDELDAAKADAITLITLLHLRDIAEKTGKRVPIVSEMLDITNRRLAEITNADDFVVSDRLVSLMLSQISQNKELNTVFKDLFSPEGSEVYLKPIEYYVRLDTPTTFATVIEAASQRGEIAFGYKLARKTGDASEGYGVVVSPKKSVGIAFQPGDKLIVLAES